jgi:hypothetical protein
MAERRLLVWGDKEFTIAIPEDTKVTFGPWSPSSAGRPYGADRGGTLRIEESEF